MDGFTLMVTVGMIALLVWIIALGIWHPRSGREILDWKPTRSAEVEFQNDLDDVAQMIAAQNAIRERRGKAARTQDEVEAQVRDDQRVLREYADAYWTEQRASRVTSAEPVRLTVYVKDKCSNCRRLARLLDERGVAYDAVDFHAEPLSAARIAELLAKAGVTAHEALRLKEPGAAELADASEAEVVAAMAADPALLQRPFVEAGDRAVLARPTERVLQLLA